jgi:hypothetical protein
MATEKRATEQQVQRHAQLATAQEQATLRATEEEIARKEAELLEAKEAAEERATVLAAEAEAAREAARLESERRREAEEKAALKVAELEEARRAAQDDASRMASKAKQIAEIARQEVARVRVERKLLEETTAKRLAEIEAERRAAERAAKKQAERRDEVDLAERRRAEREARREAGERARQEAELLIAQRAREAAARQEAEERARLEAAAAAEKQAHREEWTRRLRNVGNIAASIGIIAIAAAGADKIVGWSSGGRDAARVQDVRTEQPAASRPAVADDPADDRPQPRVDSLAVLPPAIEDSGFELEEVGAGAVRGPGLESDALAAVLVNTADAYALTAEEFVVGRRSCADLQQAFIEVDGAWLEYSMKRSDELANANQPFDATRVARDDELTDRVREVEAAFAATGCPRP